MKMNFPSAQSGSSKRVSGPVTRQQSRKKARQSRRKRKCSESLAQDRLGSDDDRRASTGIHDGPLDNPGDPDLSDSEQCEVADDGSGDVDGARGNPEEDASVEQAGCMDYCENCMRQYIPASESDCSYSVKLKEVPRCEIRVVVSPLKRVSSCRSELHVTPAILCEECCRFLRKPNEGLSNKEHLKENKAACEWRYAWPSFLWDLLVGEDQIAGKPFCDVYDGGLLWKFIPETLRPFWRRALTRGHGDSYPFIECAGMGEAPDRSKEPASYFVDRTRDILKFEKDIVKSRELKKLVELLRRDGSGEDKPIILPDVLCPWGCTEFCFAAKDCCMALMIQNHLRKVQLNMPSTAYFRKMDLVETSRLDFLRGEGSPYDSDVAGEEGASAASGNSDSSPAGLHRSVEEEGSPPVSCCQDFTAANQRIEEEYDSVLMNRSWRIRPHVLLLPLVGLVVLTCRYHAQDSYNTVRRLYPHPPRKPGHNLSSTFTDDIAHAKLCPRGATPVQALKFNTLNTVHCQQGGFAGFDSFNVVPGGGTFKNSSVLLNDHAALSVAGRPDINQLMDRMVTEGVMPEELARNVRAESSMRYGQHSVAAPKLARCREGATYVSVADSMTLHLNPPKSTVALTVLRKSKLSDDMYESTVGLPRSWAPVINFLETEDCRGYGTMLKPTLSYAPSQGNPATMILWAVAGIISGCKEVHHAIDQKALPFRHDEWAGHVMAHVHHTCMTYDDSSSPKGSPFKPNRSQKFLVGVMERCLPPSMVAFEGSAVQSPESYYRFSFRYWLSLFPPEDFTSISVQASVGDAVDHVNSQSTDVVIVVQSSTPEERPQQDVKSGHIVIDGVDYEARVILCIDAQPSENGCRRSKFKAERFARRGGGFSQWQKQTRGSPLMMICDRNRGEGDFPALRRGCFSYVTVYVKTSTRSCDQYRNDLHRSLGGQVHVFCNCVGAGSFPLIVSGRRREEKRMCMEPGCPKKEHYTCCNDGSCDTRICLDHFEQYCKGDVKWLDPPTCEPCAEAGVGANGLATGDDVGVGGNSSATDATVPEGQAPARATDAHPPTLQGTIATGSGVLVEDVDMAEDEGLRRTILNPANNLRPAGEWMERVGDDGASTRSAAVERAPDGRGDNDASDDDDWDDDEWADGDIADSDDDEEEEEVEDEREWEEESIGHANGDTGYGGIGDAFEDEEMGDGASVGPLYAEDYDYYDLEDEVVEEEDDASDAGSEGGPFLHFHTGSLHQRIRDLDEEVVEVGPSTDRNEEALLLADKRREVRETRTRKIERVRAKQDERIERAVRERAGQDGDKDAPVPPRPRVEGGNLLGEFLTESHYDPQDRCPKKERRPRAVPSTNPGAIPYSVLPRSEQTHIPCHVLFNQAGALCTRYNKRIEGSYAQQNFIQRIVSTVQGFAMPILYFMATVFPRHFPFAATHDPSAILGCAPLSCYSGSNCPHGFASSLSITRNLVTHSSSSASTDPNMMAFCYDMQANKVAGGIHSQLLNRSGFMVDVKSREGITVRDKDASPLNESVDSHQAALDLAATQPFVQFDWFLTFTCNQAKHPGISHLHRHKEGMEWTEQIEGYSNLSQRYRDEVKLSFEMAYGAVLGRCWLEVRKLWLEQILFDVSKILGRVAHVFFRDEFQEKRGNLSHIHGLVALSKEDMTNEELREKISELLKCAVCDMFPADKLHEYIEEGLLENEQDWHTVKAIAAEVLPHKHNDSCQRRVKDTDGNESFRCRKPHAVFGRDRPMEDEWKPLKYEFSAACLDVLSKCRLWDPPSAEYPNGRFHSQMLEPKRHMGAVHPGARCNCSPCIDQFFAVTRSMQNAQVLTGTNGVARYVVKYIVKLDEGNRCVVWADSHSGAVIRAEHTFLHNTKITSSKANEDKAFAKSRGRNHPVGRQIAFTEMQQQLLGYPEVMTTLNFARISTKPFEERSTTKVKLNQKGELLRKDLQDSHSSKSPSDVVRSTRSFPPDRQMTPSQKLLYRGCDVAYDRVTQFGLRPVELFQLFRGVGNYYRWFHIGKQHPKIEEALHEDITRCAWVDGLGRSVLLRRGALKEVEQHLRGIASDRVTGDSWKLRQHLLGVIEKEVTRGPPKEGAEGGPSAVSAVAVAEERWRAQVLRDNDVIEAELRRVEEKSDEQSVSSAVVKFFVRKGRKCKAFVMARRMTSKGDLSFKEPGYVGTLRSVNATLMKVERAGREEPKLLKKENSWVFHAAWAYIRRLPVVLKSTGIDLSAFTNSRELFIYEDRGEDLPIPVYSSVTPRNAVPFLLHLMLTLGEFDTELDLRLQPTMRESFVAANLIDGTALDDEAVMEENINRLLRMVVQRVFAVQPVTLRRLDYYIVMSKQILNGVLLRNEMPISELPPCLLTQMLDSKSEELREFQLGKRNDQLEAITKNLPAHIQTPERRAILLADKGSPLDWDALSSFTPFEAQSAESYQEQRMAVEVGMRSIVKYGEQFGSNAATATRGEIVHGSPGSGKTHVIQYLLLYAMSQGLRTMVTALMAARANALGGVHIHRLFGIMARKTGNPYRLAELALEKLHRKSQIKYLHMVLTMDLLVIDECGQLSAQQLSVLDIILRKARGSELPFGGVLVLGTMDHTQLGAIEGWPFLVSSHILTEFTLVKLCQSVRAHSDRDFQRIQELTRMSPMKLLSDPQYEREFKGLLRESFEFIPSWDDRRITTDVQQMFSRRIPAYEASKEYVDRLESRFKDDGVPYLLSDANDLQALAGTRAEFVPARSESIIRALNKEMKEPKRLLFHSGATFEATLNGDGFNQSQLVVMVKLPTAEEVASRTPLALMAAPCGESYVDQSDGVPTEEELVERGWTHVKVGHIPERPITRRGLMGVRQQYALRHTGSSTINKQMGNTITGKCAVECSKGCAPWEKAQIVVCLSRTRRAKDTMIVGPVDFAVDHMWKLITVCHQWTPYVEQLLERLSVNGNDDGGGVSRMMDLCEVFPYRTCDITLPDDSTGYVYLLVSVRDFDRDYVGQTENLARRFDEHQRGEGSKSTSNPYYRPWCVAAYICGLSHMGKAQREGLERQWKQYNKQAIASGRNDISARIDQGQRIVEEYNDNCTANEQIRLVVTIKRTIDRRENEGENGAGGALNL